MEEMLLEGGAAGHMNHLSGKLTKYLLDLQEN